MVIHTERTGEEEQVITALRSVFDASVMNFGSYNLLYAQNLLEHPQQHDAAPAGKPSGEDRTEFSAQESVAGSPDLLVGYRREPAELVLCPFDTGQILDRLGQYDDAVATAEVPVLLNLTNLAGMAVEDSIVEIAFSTGIRMRLSLRPTVTFGQMPELSVRQHLDVEDFYDFLDYFMDKVDRKLP